MKGTVEENIVKWNVGLLATQQSAGNAGGAGDSEFSATSLKEMDARLRQKRMDDIVALFAGGGAPAAGAGAGAAPA